VTGEATDQRDRLCSPTARSRSRDATATIPIVTVASDDPVRSGLAQSLSASGRNVTGVTYYATELTRKRLALLKEIVLTASSLGMLANPATADLPSRRRPSTPQRLFE
jgi:putative tryptophan/tyrosine transport system substrate-binding protein